MYSFNNEASTGLEPYVGDWTVEQATHLLKRCTFGPVLSEIDQALAMGMEASIGALLASKALPDPPINYNDGRDVVAIGETWINHPVPRSSRVPRRRSLLAWTILQQLQDGFSIREKMTLFWHNHFSIEQGIVNDARFLYQYQDLLRQNALGNFRELTKAVTVNPAMLRYLDGRRNIKNKPNENYGRELLELFTIGKGPLAAPGDYTNYTEDDVLEMARILTGWRDYGYNSDSIAEPTSEFVPARHDTNTKTLSHRFDSAHFEDGGMQEYAQLINLIFSKDEVAYFISRKLYRWLVNYDIPTSVEDSVIRPMAELLIESDYEIKPVLRALLCSAHFYSADLCGAIIKNPIEYTVALLRQGQVVMGNNEIDTYKALWKVYQFMDSTQMAYFKPPSVAGWPAFYQEPVYYQSWINTATLAPRVDFGVELSSSRGWGNFRLKMDVLGIVSSIPLVGDPNVLIDKLSLLFYAQSLADNQKAFLKEVLIPGLPDFEWTVEYGKYLGDPTDRNLAESVEQRLRNLFQALIRLPETQLS